MNADQFQLVPIEAGPPPQVIELRGEVDATNAPDLQRELEAITAGGPAIVDLSPVDYLDSAGFAVLDRLLAARAVTIVIALGGIVHRAASLIGVCLPRHRRPAREALTEGAAG